MNYRFVSMNAMYAREIAQWRYEGEYAFYDYANAESLLDPMNWEAGQFVAVDE